MIHKDLCDARYTTYWSPLRMQLHFLFATVHTWDGEIPLSLNEIKDRLKCHIDTLKKLLNEAEHEGIITRREGKIFFNKCVFDDSQSYVKNFPFLHSLEFRNEDVRVIRFVLHMLSCGVYSRRMLFNNSLNKLHHRDALDKCSQEKIRVYQGLFNIYSAADMKNVIQKAQKYLVFASAPSHIVRVVGLKSEYHAPVVRNQGEFLFIKKYLAEYGLDDVSEEIITEIVKVNSRYVKGLGVELGKELIKEVLFRLLSVLNGSNSTFIDLLLHGEPRELGLYYSKVCEEFEESFASIISRRKEYIENAHSSLIGNRVQAAANDCYEWFAEKVRNENKRLTQYIKKFDEYWINVMNRSYHSPVHLKTVLARFKKSSLYEYLSQVREAIHSIKLRHTQPKVEEFVPYNWLEN